MFKNIFRRFSVGYDRGYGFMGAQVQKINDRFASGLPRRLRNFIDMGLKNPALSCKE
ncbi:MAG: hypothetical protein UX55_C0013G0013 [Candidatus Azambacteria bacterium GW2011_GWE2_46_45]|uniref:Uncharacterized protein n=1 Tax=Candidatus Azambacteria bacterium GW2011_GWE2_46_45 TaxID=1618625 RepID=A0A0G1SDJ8_9BACT|nr:MAG: hypothetical protein UX55_C0013G0013 [Candidatus Azambacteria bacterium GW2011_GWE2_46_45]